MNDFQDTFIAASVNFTPVYGDTKATLEKMLDNIREAAAQGADLVVFPEVALRGCGSCDGCRAAGGPCDHHLETSETVPGPSTETILKLSRDTGVYVVLGMAERTARCAHVVQRCGRGRPRRHPRHVSQSPPRSLPWVTEGSRSRPARVAAVPDPVRADGCPICYDFWFNPELTRILALKGARVIAVPVGSFAAPDRHESMRATARRGRRRTSCIPSSQTPSGALVCERPATPAER